MNITHEFYNHLHANNTHYDHIGQQQSFMEVMDNHLTDIAGSPLIEDHYPQ